MKTIKYALLVGIVPVISIYLVQEFFIACNLRNKELIREEAEQIIFRIKTFEKNKKKLPNSLTELGNDIDDNFFTYKKIDEKIFKINYDLSFDDPRMYCSRNNKWSEDVSTC